MIEIYIEKMKLKELNSDLIWRNNWWKGQKLNESRTYLRNPKINNYNQVLLQPLDQIALVDTVVLFMCGQQRRKGREGEAMGARAELGRLWEGVAGWGKEQSWPGRDHGRPGSNCGCRQWWTLPGEGKERIGIGSNGDIFVKQNTRRCRGNRYEPCDSLGIRRGRRSWSEKFAVATSAIDVGQTDWRLAKPIILLRSAREGERWHVFICRV